MTQIDLVYILGGGSRWSNNELRYSLRSVEKFFLNKGRVFIIGDCPEWATNITHIQVADNEQNKILNARNKYRVAALHPGISKDFVLMNDDFFFLRPTDEIPYFSRGTIKEMMELHPTKGGYYYHSLYDTHKRLDAMGIKDAIDFEVHAPIIFNKEKLLSVMGMIGTRKVYSLRSCYGNLMNAEPVKTLDFKAANIGEFALQMRRNYAPFLSINDALVASEDFRNWMSGMFPDKSKYEIHDDDLKTLPGRAIAYRKYHATKEFRYGGKIIKTGDLIPQKVMDQIKNNPSMAGVWAWK